MKLIFKKAFLSISNFKNSEIADFSIITGLNGSGKTQLLKAIENGSIEITGIDDSQIKYYNYNDFTVNSQKFDTVDMNKRNKALYYDKSGKIIEHIRKSIGEIIKEIRKPNTNILDHTFYNFYTSGFDIDEYFNNEEDFVKLNEFKHKIINSGHLPPFQHIFSEKFYHFLQNFVSVIGFDLNEIQQDILRKRNKLIQEQIENALKTKDPAFYDFIKSKLGNKILLPFARFNIENPNFSLLELQEAQKNYEIQIFNDIAELIYGEEKQIPSKEKQIDIYGYSPIEQINQILNEYDCNGYYLTTNNFKIKFGVDITKIEVPIKLINKKTNLSADFEYLSSGEKTLIALAILIYKSKREALMPRVILLDEIDSSLHPSMIKRLLDVISNIFIEKNKIKVILATHSPTTVALAPEESIFVIHKDQETKLTKKSKADALNILTEGYATLDQGLKLFDQISKKNICIFSEGNNINYLRKANEFYGNSNIDIIGGIENMTGKDQLNTLFKFFSKVPHSNKIFFVWDCDVKNSFSIEGNTFPFVFSKNNESRANKGIENLFSSSHFQEQFYDIKTNDYGGTVKDLNKKRFEEYILKQGTKEDFDLFKPLFDFIQSNT
jgi:energy-coupling factor transporter ATP-binding protein EcfA2